MQQSTKYLSLFLGLSLVFAYPQQAFAGKNNFFKNLKRAVIDGDPTAGKKIFGGDVGRAIAAAHGDEAARKKLKRDWENAQEKVDRLASQLSKLLGEDEEERAIPAASGVAKAATSTEEPTTAGLAELNARMAALEARLEEELRARALAAATAASTVSTPLPAAAGAGSATATREEVADSMGMGRPAPAPIGDGGGAASDDKRADLEALMAQAALEESLRTATHTAGAPAPAATMHADDPSITEATNNAAATTATLASTLGRAQPPVEKDPE